MASKEVLQALDALHKELDKLAPAIRHVEAAQQVTESVKEFSSKHLELIENIEKSSLKFNEDIKELFSKEIAGIAEETKKLQNSTSDLQKKVDKNLQAIISKYNEQLNELKEKDAAHKEMLSTVFSNEVENMALQNQNLQNATKEIQQQVITQLESLAKLHDTIQSYYHKLEKINFPERLDKLDANVAGIMAAVQAVQGRVDRLESNLIDRLKELKNYQQDSIFQISKGLELMHDTLLASIAKIERVNKLYSIITWILILLGVASIIIVTKL